ncbi:MAG TPA: hypothetical protein PKA10_00075 [Selenomonadales bacterium]|nr:hypothetical protein [Selenomonadales bacterium]
MSDEWIKWIPWEGLPSKMYLERFVDDKSGISFLMTGKDGSQIQIVFDGSVLSYRNTDEGRRLKTINFLEQKYGKEFYATWSMFKVVKSEYLEWFGQETYNMYNDYSIVHYVFLTCNDILEVLSTYEPQITFINNKG